MQIKSLLIIGAVWVEPNSSAAGKRMLQLIAQFLERDYKITFASPAQKNEKAIDLFSLGINEVSIALNNVSFDNFIKELNPTIVLFDRFMMEEQFGWRVAENCPNAVRILDTEDLHFLRKTRQQQLKKGEAFTNDALLQSDDTKREIASILRCDVSLIISTYEMDLLKSVFKIDEKILYYLPFLLDTIDENQIKGIIIGNPINMDGTESQSSQSAKDLAINLSKDVTENITLWDERLSSQGAFNLSNELASNTSNKVKKLDENSAQFILQGALDYITKENT